MPLHSIILPYPANTSLISVTSVACPIGLFAHATSQQPLIYPANTSLISVTSVAGQIGLFAHCHFTAAPSPALDDKCSSWLSSPLCLNYPMLLYPSPLSRGQSSNEGRAWRRDSCSTKPRKLPLPNPPHPATPTMHRWRCGCSGVCVCGNVVLVHFPTIVVGHGPGTHLAGLYNRRWLPPAVTILRQALAEFVSRGVGSHSASVVC
jgi:hypothetical protein